MSRDPNFVKQASFRALRKIVTEIIELFVVVDQSVAASVLTPGDGRATVPPQLQWQVQGLDGMKQLRLLELGSCQEVPWVG